MALSDLALSRSRLDKVSDNRFAPDLLARLLEDPTTCLLPVLDGRAPVTGSAERPRLRTASGRAAAALLEHLGGAQVVAAGGADPGTGVVPVHLGLFPADDPRAPGALVGLLVSAAALDGLTGQETWPADLVPEPLAGLREVGALLDDTDAGALTEAVALQHWHVTSPRCARCGGATRLTSAGHERVCQVDGSTHHPRHDPAVIMTVTDPAGRLLLGHQGRWPQGRFSAFAGFVEPGESLEQAVARELLEESGVHAREMVYLGSQPWPFPASIMLAFHVETDDTVAVPDGEEITEARWFQRQELVDAVASGEIGVPPRVSVARRLIERWLGHELQTEDTWR